MRAPSSQVEADQIAAELERLPRTREISERVTARVEACQTKDERAEWLELLGGDRVHAA